MRKFSEVVEIDDDKLIIEAVDWYTKKRGLYKQLSDKVHNIISELLDINSINIHAISSRAKEIDSFADKIKDSKYNDPTSQITDLAGIRVICYVDSDIKRICKVIEDNFDIDKPNSTDKSKLLGTDKVGYKSVHFVAKLSNQRLTLPEYQKFTDCKFEIQIRTILQHAWAEIEHDRNYKFSGELPDDVQRRFKLLAGTLELVDIEFDNIAKEIDKIKIEVTKGTKSGKLNFDINTTTLKQFLVTKFEEIIPSLIEPYFASPNDEIKILKEIKDYGLSNLDELNKIIPSDFIEKYKTHSALKSNFMGLIRVIMICVDWKNYFENAYKNNWTINSLKIKRTELLNSYNVPLNQIIETYEIKNKK